MKILTQILVIFALLAVTYPAVAQDAESLKIRIEEHYAAINQGDSETAFSHHLPEFSYFNNAGNQLWEPGFQETAARMGIEPQFVDVRVMMRHFSAKIYGDVGVATFYLNGSFGDTQGTWRVTAVWVWRDGEWLEAHHHESRLEP
ncbi:nuclear transport factor 2 family protein [Aliifodinibius sp. S!AR15-10]|uniref:nuclear transport factor 2 family protein n=1 Tax=Aliifodinibius sp. S!AR15-10 TaxID=2950437 RepID=UPI00285ED24A|nr:nuclear transport factor 2 family protein [Aliifodinibius sp. S!AR15-10]MDR8389571.1 nuclear transport factor 2 family protein [Aliifodinibius sp. S!AR15-10]